MSRRCDLFDGEPWACLDLLVLEELADPLAPPKHPTWFAGSGLGSDVSLDGGVQPVKANLDGFAVPIGGLPRRAETIGREETVLTPDVDGVVA